MNEYLINKAIGLARQMVINNRGKLPDWSSYGRAVRVRLGLPDNVALPKEYLYGYLRTKGHNHAEAIEHLRLGAHAAAN